MHGVRERSQLEFAFWAPRIWTERPGAARYKL